MFKLIPHKANNSDIQGPEVQLRVEGDLLIATFSLELKDAVYTSNEFDSGYKNWGLWDYDVFELFLSRNTELNAPYLELQVSPLNQKLALIIEKPRQKWFYPETSVFTSKTTIEDNKWVSTFKIDLGAIPGNSNIVYGNAHAILGNPRNYYAAVPNEESTPDFHRPELFTELINLENK